MKALASRGSDTLDRRNSPSGAGGGIQQPMAPTYGAAFRMYSAEYLICDPTPKNMKFFNLKRAWHKSTDNLRVNLLFP